MSTLVHVASSSRRQFLGIDALVRRSLRDPGFVAISGVQVNDTNEADHGDELLVTNIPCSSKHDSRAQDTLRKVTEEEKIRIS